MLLNLYDYAKKVFFEQNDMKGIISIYSNHEYKPYFNIYTNKYFTLNPKKKDERRDYNVYYREVKNKNDLKNLINYLDTNYNNCLDLLNNEDKEIHDWQVEQLEELIAEFEIAIGKIITCQNLLKTEYNCSKNEIIDYMKKRDMMIEKVESLKTRTVEYYRMMWD